MPAKKQKKETEAKPEVIPKKKVIYIDIDDEVTNVHDKIKSARGKHVYIVVPQRSIIFQSIVNLKILKRKAKEERKTISLITNDENGIHLAQKIGIEVYNQKNEDGKPALFSTDLSDDRLSITPLKASVNAVEDEAPTRLSEKKISISEILRKGRRKTRVKAPNVSEKKDKKTRSKLVIISPNRHALVGLISVTMIILLAVVYIALPGVTIYITPTASVLEKSVNITLADADRNAAELATGPTHMIASFPVETEVSRTLNHFATGKKVSDKAANASGVLNIINTSDIAWPLVQKTRFQTEDGVVFRLQSAVTVPASDKIEAYVVADETDAFGVITGKRGNIDASTFFLPGLRESSRAQLYAESTEPMTGGVTDFVTFITAEDLAAAEVRINEDLVLAAREELRKAVAAAGAEIGNEEIYMLLEGDNTIEIGESEVAIDPGLEGRQIAEFSVGGKVSVSGIYYQRSDMLAILMRELELKKSPQKELLRVNESSTSYRIFEWDERANKIKLTANIKGVEQFEIDSDKESGANLIQKIRDHVAGKNIEEAKLYIQNLPEINKAEIESWPAWSPSIPNIADNIDFEIRDAVTLE